MSVFDDWKSLNDLGDVATFLGCRPQSLAYAIYISKEKYKTFQIPKKNGGIRTILAPEPKLKNLQRTLAHKLTFCLEEIYRHNGGNKAAHGFLKDRTIITNAKKHRNKKYVLNLDLSDFFGTINFGRVRGFFIKNKYFSLNEKVATIIAQLACYDNKLPQGSPCSPVLSNLILAILDLRLLRLASQYSCTYTRYADDITFSTNLTKFPEKLALNNNGEIIVGSKLGKAICDAGFQINMDKVRLQYSDSRQDVTGLIVNKIVNVPECYRGGVRVMAHTLFKSNSFYIKKDKNPEHHAIGTMEQLGGMLSYIYSIRRETVHHNHEKRKDNGEPLLDSSDLLYSDFLFYKYFMANDRPILVCEGKTDIIYIKYAIKSLSDRFPELVVENNPGGGIDKTLKIQLLGCTKTVNHLLDLLNGTSAMKRFLGNYKKRAENYKEPPLKYPVIFITDNDSGAKDIIPAINNKYRGEVNNKGGFWHVTKNLYYMKTPLVDGKDESKIEDFFTEELLSRKIEGKTFNPENNIDNIAHYSKHIFAEKIVKKEHKSIDFSGFNDLLLLVDAIIQDYKK